MMHGRKRNKPYVFNKTVIGASHLKLDTKCQDYSIAEINPTGTKNIEQQYAIAIVADGHGSADYFRSDKGSRLACEASLNVVKRWMDKNPAIGINNNKGIKYLRENSNKSLEQLKKSILTLWHEKIEDDYSKEPFTQEELEAMPEKAKQKLDVNPSLYIKPYGTTLIVVVKHSKFWIALHIGDGKCVTYKKGGEPEQPIPWDERCFLNVTTSMSDEDALKRFRHYYSENHPDAIYIATDGVDDSYASDERLHNFYIKLTNSFIDTGAEQTVKELEAFLPILSEEGSGDDISIAGIVSL